MDSRFVCICFYIHDILDEDFNVLIEAVEIVEKSILSENISFPRVVVAITGKGPMLKEMMKKVWMHSPSYKGQPKEDETLDHREEKERIGKDIVSFTHFSFHPLWLESEDYPTFLSGADCGM
jgi:hypothetical protein